MYILLESNVIFVRYKCNLTHSFIHSINQCWLWPNNIYGTKQARIHGKQILSLPNFTLTEQKKLEYSVERTLRTTDNVSVAINQKE